MISPWDRGFLYGDGVFATLRTYAGRLFALDDHLDLLIATAATLHLDLSSERERLRSEALHAAEPHPQPLSTFVERGASPPPESPPLPLSTTVERGPGGEAIVRLIATRGEGAGAALSAHTPPTLLALAEPLTPLPLSLHRDGITVETRPAPGGTLGPKTLSYLPHLRALDEARRRGHGEVLWRDERGALGQGATSNLLVALSSGELVAPSPAAGRSGVTRRWVLRLAPGLGLRVAERPVTPDDRARATEVMVCSTLREVVSVVAIDGTPVGAGRPGTVAVALRRALREAAGGLPGE